MTAEIKFVSKDWVRLDEDTQQVSIELDAKPPVGAVLRIVVFSKDIEPAEATWTKKQSVVIDNLAYTNEITSTSFPVQSGKFFSVKLQGEAHLLMPGYDEISVGLRVLGDNGKAVEAFKAPKPVKGETAGLIGVLYFQVGE